MPSHPIDLELLKLDLQTFVLDERITPSSPYAALIFDCDGTIQPECDRLTCESWREGYEA